MVETAQCANAGTDKCPLNIDDRVDGLEGRVTDLDKDYRTFKLETAASQARTQALQEEAAKRDKERAEIDAQRAKDDAARQKQMMNLICSGKQADVKLIWKLVGIGAVIVMAIMGLKALIPSLLF